MNAQTNAYLRIAALAISAYDYVLTLPAEWRLYRNQKSIIDMSIVCILFILIRYSSIFMFVVSNYGYFATTFTQESCQRFYMVAPVAKALQTMASQAILDVRAVSISQRRSWVIWVIISLFIITSVLEMWINVYHRNAITVDGNCSAGNIGSHLTTWAYYLISMVYDLVTLAISTWFLFKLNIRDPRFSRIPKIMFYDGIGYFVVLTASNIYNLILYRMKNPVLQSSGANLGFAVVWIMSQRILIHLREVVIESNKTGDSAVLRSLQSKRVAKAVRPQTDTKSHTPTDSDVELQIRVEQNVLVDCDESWGHDRVYHLDKEKV